MFRYSRSGFSATWPDALSRARRHSWGSTLRSLAPATRGKPCVIRTALAHLPFPVHPSRPIFAGRSIARGLRRSPTLEGDQPRMPQRGSWALSSRAIRALPMPPLADRQGRYCLGLGLFQACRHRLMRSRCFFQSLAGRQPPEAASGSYPLLDFVGGTFLRCSGKAIAEENRRNPPILQRIEGLTPS